MCLLKMKCRTCLETFNMDCMSSLQNKLSIGMSIQELLLLIVPGMIMSKSVKDFICGDCMKVIQGFIKFIQKLITVEKHLRAKAASVTQSLEQDITLKSSVRDFNVTPINNASVNSDGSGKSDEPHSLTNSDEANKTDKPPGNIPEDDSSVNSDDSDKITEPLESIKELEDTTKEKVADTINPTTVENHLTSNESDVTETLGQETVSDSDVCLNETPIDTIYVSSDEEPEKTIKQKSVDFVHTILKDFQNKQRHCNYIDLKTPEKDNSNLEMKKSIPLGKAAHFNQPARTYSRKNQNQMVNSEESFSKEQSLQLTEDCNESLALTTKLLQSKDGDGVTSDNIEEHRPPTLLSVKNKSAGTNDSYITTVVPSMVSADSVISHNRAISITTTNRVIELLLKSFFRSKYNLSWQTPSENKRIIFLGNKLLNLNCHICKTSFSSQDSVTVHFQQEHPNETYPGSDDEFQPDELIEYIPEKKSCHNCPVCSEPFRTIRLLNSHINRNHKDYYRFLCEKCGHKFKKKFNYKLHLQKYERYQCCNVKKCHVCREVLSADAVMEHYETHKTLQCFLCKKKFLSENNFNKHLLLHQNQLDNPKPKKILPKESLCPICGKLLSNNNTSFQMHIESHSQERTFMCDKCPKYFKSVHNLRRHLKHVHVEGKKYQCATCGKLTKTRSNLWSHQLLKHTDEYKHACAICGATFKRGDYYRRHLRNHSYANPFQVSRHKRYRITSTERSDVPLSCKYCDRKFNYIIKLRKHLLEYHLMASTKFECPYCQMTFANKGNKNRHMQIHMNPKLFESTCQVCHRRFASKTEKEDHFAAHHKGSTKRKCDVCGETFPSKYLMMNHKRHQHFGPEVIEKQRDALFADALSEYTID